MATPQINLKDLAKFLVKAKKATYAGEGREVAAERPGFKELEYKEGIWTYRDSYVGFYSAPGQEVVRLRGVPVWAMAYSGGMKEKFSGIQKLAKDTFGFLKEMLSQVEESAPFRGPVGINLSKDGRWKYITGHDGDIKNFKGSERIILNQAEVFSQDYMGGLIVGK